MAHISTMEKLGIPAPSFILPNLNAVVKGQTVSLETFEEYPALLVVFICNHCPYVVHIRDSFVSFVSEYDEKGLGVVAISSNDVKNFPDDSPEQMTEDAVKFSYPFPYLFDEKQDIYPQYGANKTPHVFLLNKENGDNVVRYIGAIDDNHQDVKAVKNHFLKDALNSLLDDEEIERETTVAIGCSIKS